eukprot:6264623-Pyramimonas_sp.AAC.1
MFIPGTGVHRLLLGKGARVIDLVKTPSGHLAIKVGEYGVAAEADGATAFTVAANPQSEGGPVLIEEAADMEPIAGQL